jgi:subtilisin family serine protease
MPLKLIAPIAHTAASSTTQTVGATWGLEAIGALTSPYTGAGVKVAVLDTGIDASHVAFADVRLDQRNYTSEAPEDTDGHGTHCAGTIFGRDVAGRRIGVARGVVDAFIGKVLGRGGGGSDGIVRAIMDALTADCQVISMSLGLDYPGYFAQLRAQGLDEDIAAAVALSHYRANVRLFDRVGQMIAAHAQLKRRDILVLAASGNESKRDLDPKHEFPAAPPSEAEGFVSVGAAGMEADGLVIAPFSNTGCMVCAPGVGIESAKAGTRDGLIALSGTSMATPHVAGVAALLIEAASSNTATSGLALFPRALDLRERLIGTARPHGFAGGETPVAAGSGLVQSPQRPATSPGASRG